MAEKVLPDNIQAVVTTLEKRVAASDSLRRNTNTQPTTADLLLQAIFPRSLTPETRSDIKVSPEEAFILNGVFMNVRERIFAIGEDGTTMDNYVSDLQTGEETEETAKNKFRYGNGRWFVAAEKEILESEENQNNGLTVWFFGSNYGIEIEFSHPESEWTQGAQINIKFPYTNEVANGRHVYDSGMQDLEDLTKEEAILLSYFLNTFLEETNGINPSDSKIKLVD